jgi:uncharacterized protein
MNRRTIAALAATTATLAVPAVAAAHVTVHPNVIPEGAFAVLNVRVPNETEDADTTKVSVQMPPGIEFASVAPPPGWTADVKTTGKEVTQLDFSGGSLPPYEFIEFPVSLQVPGRSGDTLTFKAVQTYSDGEVVRWIGAADADEPAPTITISDEGGLVEDSTGEGAPAPAAATKVVREESSNGWAIAALIVGGLGLAAGGAALMRGRG